MKLFVHIGLSGLLSSGEVFSPFFFFFSWRENHFLKSHEESIGANGVFVDYWK